MGKGWKIVLLLFLVALLSLIDLGLNIIGIVFPSIGGAFETVSETIIELTQFAVTAIGALFIAYGGKK